CEMVMPAGAVGSVHDNVSPSSSLAAAWWLYVLSSVALVSGVLVSAGGSFTAATSTDHKWLVTPPSLPSLSRTWRLRVPTCAPVGVHESTPLDASSAAPAGPDTKASVNASPSGSVAVIV